ncbi:hypothetical protein DPMN_173051 [Dreissena polymorpha]|uniref:Uncharacterized protein n=1 Tax=Dreissena polymorpha TaxID=45954 RepID=A0A9D4IH76_DREPO|nr:hypothetical protein DPMN_173051 [Dreissena polymorpha]
MFEGLEHVRTLNMSGCKRRNQTYLIESFDTNTSLPRLEVLDLSFVGIFKFKFAVDDDFLTIFRNRPIKKLILRGAVISSINLPDLQRVCNNIELEGIDLTDARVDAAIHDSAIKVICKNIKSVDFTGVDFPRQFISCMIINDVANISGATLQLNRSMSWILGAEKLTWSRFCPEQPKPKRFINITDFTIMTGQPAALKRLKSCDNNIQVIDVSMTYEFVDSNIEDFVFCNNSLEYINHKALFFRKTLKYLDFSSNDLNKMILKNQSEFKMVFASLYNLLVLNLSRNKFTTLPPDLFVNNSKLRVLDLSNNLLEDFPCIISNHSGMQLLNLSSNQILTLDVTSRAIDLIDRKAFVDISQNPLRCSKCEDSTSVRWLLHTDAVIYKNALRCSTGQVGIKEHRFLSKFTSCLNVSFLGS